MVERQPGLALLVLLVLGTACASRGDSLQADPSASIAWPPPPAEAKIQYIKSFRSPRDLGIRKTWLVRFFSYLARGRSSQEMIRPYAVASDGSGTMVVADPDGRCVHVFDTLRSRYERLSSAGDQAFVSPVGVAVDADGVIYISDSHLGRVFRYRGGGDWGQPLGSEGDLVRPTGLAFDEELGRLYVVDTAAHNIAVYGSDGARIGTIGHRGSGEGEFNYPVAVTVGPEGRLFVSDSMNFRVQVLDSSGRHLGSFGEAGLHPGSMDKSKGLAVDRDGHIYVAEALHDVIQVFDESGQLLTVIGGTGTGPGEFWLPSGVHIDPEGRIFVADSGNGRVQILKYLGDPAGEGAQ